MLDISTSLARRSDGPMSMPVGGSLPMPALAMALPHTQKKKLLPFPTAPPYQGKGHSGRIHKGERQKATKRC